MRIIAGSLRGRTFLPPASDATRPITDRVKQSVFDILAPRIEGATVYDCFAGTGSMGLECLSRGAAAVTFFEADRSAVAILKKNIQALDVGDRATVVAGDLFKWFSSSTLRVAGPHAGRVCDSPKTRPACGPATRGADLIFLDPPYRMLRENADALRGVATQVVADHLCPDGIVVFRHDAADSLSLTPLNCYDQRTYGSMIVELLHANDSLAQR